MRYNHRTNSNRLCRPFLDFLSNFTRQKICDPPLSVDPKNFGPSQIGAQKVLALSSIIDDHSLRNISSHFYSHPVNMIRAIPGTLQIHMQHSPDRCRLFHSVYKGREIIIIIIIIIIIFLNKNNFIHRFKKIRLFTDSRI